METTTQAAPSQTPATQRVINTPQLITAMLKAEGRISDLIFSPGRAPQVELSGQLVQLKFKGLECLSAADTEQIARDIIGKNHHATEALKENGSAGLSYRLPGSCRFRVNIFQQRGSYAIVMRVIPAVIPSFEELALPKTLEEIGSVRN